MSYYQRIKKYLAFWWHVHIRDGCPDPDCGGFFEMYDDRPHRDSCPKCGKSRKQLEKEFR